MAAVVLNITTADVTASSFVTAYPASSARPDSSVLNPVAGQTSANAVLVRVGEGGDISLYNNAGALDLIADVTGYWAAGSDFTSLTPSRILDTRSGLGALTAKLGTTRTLDVTIAGRGGVNVLALA